MGQGLDEYNQDWQQSSMKELFKVMEKSYVLPGVKATWVQMLKLIKLRT